VPRLRVGAWLFRKGSLEWLLCLGGASWSTERLRGWCVFSCPRHGNLVATVPSARVICRCGRQARAELSTSERVSALREDGLVPAAIADVLQLSDGRVARLLREAA
jgi:hypothetical protein